MNRKLEQAVKNLLALKEIKLRMEVGNASQEQEQFYVENKEEAWQALRDALATYRLPSVLDIQHGGSHYKNRGIQPIEYAQANALDWKQFNVVKYVTRHGDKGGVGDLKKAMHYLQMILEFDYGVRSRVEYDEPAKNAAV